jgi:precorrin-6B methylase 2
MPELADNSQTLLGLINGYQVSRSLYVAAHLDLAGLLDRGAMHYADLAAATSTNASALHRLLRFLTTFSVFADEGNGRFSNGPLGRHLRTNDEHSMRAGALLFGGRTQDAWQELLHTIKTGEPAYPRVFGTDTFSYRQQHQDEAANFDEAMSNLTHQTAKAVVAAYDMSRFEHVVDVGGGTGSLVEFLLNAFPGLKATIVDRPEVVARAERNLKARGLAHKASVVGGDFFEAVPAGADAYILKNVLHDWDDERACAILKSCKRAMKPEARLLVVEEVCPEHLDESFRVRRAVSADLNMLVCTGGRQRSLQEFYNLFGNVGLRMNRVIPTAAPATLLEATPQ